MIVVIDNYDSFVHNLARLCRIARASDKNSEDVMILRNDAATVQDLIKMGPDSIVLSPGPGTPEEAGICLEIIQKMGTNTPILGVCLGHQAIAQAYGGRVMRASYPVHGRASTVQHNAHPLFKGVPSSFSAGRYHSLAVESGPHLDVIARADDGTIMALTHQSLPVFGVQFHPESILTEHGDSILKNFVHLARSFHTQRSLAA